MYYSTTRGARLPVFVLLTRSEAETSLTFFRTPRLRDLSSAKGLRPKDLTGTVRCDKSINGIVIRSTMKNENVYLFDRLANVVANRYQHPTQMSSHSGIVIDIDCVGTLSRAFAKIAISMASAISSFATAHSRAMQQPPRNRIRIIQDNSRRRGA